MSLRHASASLLLAQGLSIADVSKRLGHSTVNTTAAIYLHGQSSSDSIAATKMDQLISSIPK
ncbi:MAG: tyrosine-type recombinase/integrase [Selenomonadaceae bacterium]